MSNHTPGPWKAFNASWCETFVTAPSTDNAICCLDINHATEESQETDEAQMAANARLIAAAPELLNTMQGLVAAIEAAQGSNDDLVLTIVEEHLRDAIAKATGATP